MGEGRGGGSVCVCGWGGGCLEHLLEAGTCVNWGKSRRGAGEGGGESGWMDGRWGSTDGESMQDPGKGRTFELLSKPPEPSPPALPQPVAAASSANKWAFN